MTDTPLPNDPASRSPTGEILDQSQIQPNPKLESTPSSTPELNADGTPKTPDAKPEVKDPAKPATPSAPEKYEAFKVPDGFELPEPVFQQATELFKGMKLSQDDAQKLVDFHTNALKSSVDAGEAMMTEMRTTWRNEVLKDTTLSSGTALKPEVNATIGRMLDGLGDATLAKDFREAMDLTGAGDHPKIVRALYQLAKQVTEGKPVSGNEPTAESQADPSKAPATGAHALYPNLP